MTLARKILDYAKQNKKNRDCIIVFNGPNLLLDLPCLTEAFCKKMENKHVEVILKKNYSIYDYSVIKRDK